MKFIPEILITAYACFEGIREAFYWSSLYRSGIEYRNNHDLFLLQRAVFFIIVLMYVGWVDAVFMIFTFPFFHNGCYYYTRNQLDGVYPDKFFAQSNSSTAWSSKFLTPQVRIALYAVGMSIMFYYKLKF